MGILYSRIKVVVNRVEQRDLYWIKNLLLTSVLLINSDWIQKTTLSTYFFFQIQFGVIEGVVKCVKLFGLLVRRRNYNEKIVMNSKWTFLLVKETNK